MSDASNTLNPQIGWLVVCGGLMCACQNFVWGIQSLEHSVPVISDEIIYNNNNNILNNIQVLSTNYSNYLL